MANPKPKTSSEKYRNWTAIVYPDSENTPPNWLEVLSDQHVPAYVSPLHDQDINPDGELKKAHHHVVLAFSSPCKYQKACEIFESIGAVVPPQRECIVKDFKSMARYLIHLDHPDKHRYAQSDVKQLSGIADYDTLVMTNSDETALMREITKFCQEYEISLMTVLLEYAREFRPDWEALIYRKNTMFLSTFLRSIEYEQKQQIAAYKMRSRVGLIPEPEIRPDVEDDDPEDRPETDLGQLLAQIESLAEEIAR